MCSSAGLTLNDWLMVQDHDALDHGDQHGQELRAVVGVFLDFRLQLVGHLVERLASKPTSSAEEQLSGLLGFRRRVVGQRPPFQKGLCEIARDPQAENHGDQKRRAEGRRQITLDVPDAFLDRCERQPESDHGNAGMSCGEIRHEARNIIGPFAGGLTGSDIHAPSEPGLRDFRACEMIVDGGEPLGQWRCRRARSLARR